MSYKASHNSGIYGSFHFDAMAKYLSFPGVPVIMIKRNYPIMPVVIDADPVINVPKILRIASEHRLLSSAVDALSKQLPFARVTNYIVAKQMMLDLLRTNPVDIHDDITSNEYQTPVGGFDDIIASFSSTTLQKLGTVGDQKQNYIIYDDDAKPEGRKPFVGGNWKCNGSLKSVSALAEGLSLINTSDIDVLIAPLPIHIPLVQSKLSKTKIIISSQNVSATKMGAYTGEIASTQLLDFGVNTTLIGHSERRKYYGETNPIITKKVEIALQNKLNIVCCLGETLEERKANKVEETCFASLQAIADGVGNNGWNNVVIAYEPVWAIGTGVACSPEKAQATHKGLRRWFKNKISNQVAESMRIIYGGSVKPANCKELIAQPDIDGFLVGGASLKPDSFGDIITAVRDAVGAK